MNKPRFSCVAPYKEDKAKRLIILNESITKTDLSELPQELRDYVQGQEDIQVINHSIHLDYNYFTANEVCSFLSCNRRFSLVFYPKEWKFHLHLSKWVI